MKKKKTLKTMALILISVSILASCADVTPIANCATSEPYGMLSGIWHGWIAPISLIGSLFKDSIAMYAVNNTGAWYDLGFMIGVNAISIGFMAIKNSN